MPTVFISCARPDMDAYASIAQRLQQAGHRLVAATPDLEAAPMGGSAWIMNQLDRVDAVVLVWSRSAAASAWVRQEVDLAIKAWAGDQLVLVRLDDTAMPAGLRDLQAIDLRGEPGAGPDALVAAVENRLAADGTPRTVSAPPVAGTAGTAVIGPFGGWGGAVIGGAIDTLAKAARRVAGSRGARVAGPGPAAAAGDIFVSYSRHDSRAVDRLVGQIEAAGYSVWIDRAAQTGSVRYAGPIVHAIKSSRLVALMCSRNSFQSDHVVREVYVAGDARKPFVAFQLDTTELPDELQYFLSGFPRIPVADAPPDKIRSEIARLTAAR